MQVEGSTGQALRLADSLDGLRVHMIGVGGAGMSAAAALLLRHGARVSGSDLLPFDGLGALVRDGARVSVGLQDDGIESDVDLVVASAAVPETNGEYASALRRGKRILKYAELLGLLMEHHRGVSIAGTHGKSTTTAMTAHLFRAAGLDPSFIVGARSNQLGGGSGRGSGEHLIVESCEFNRSFLHQRPESAVILNVEPDHLDFFGSFDAVIEAFGAFAANVRADGLLLVNGDDAAARASGARAKTCVETFGLGDACDWRATNLRADRGCYRFDVSRCGERVCETSLSIPGIHNVSNALAAIAQAHHAGGDPALLGGALPEFAGIDRRMSVRAESSGMTVVDDYAHHPTEIRVTLEAARNRFSPDRMFVVFQPHQAARTQHFMEEFASVLCDADEVIVPNVYGARESDAAQCFAGSAQLASRICDGGGKARHVPVLGDCADEVMRFARAGDLILTMGAGDVWKVADALVERIPA